MTTKQTFTSFDALLKESEQPVLVDFYAPWCGPCQLMASALKDVNTRLGQRLRIVKINTDSYPAIASQHNIEALPTLVLFINSQPVDRIEGAVQAEQLIARLESFL